MDPSLSPVIGPVTGVRSFELLVLLALGLAVLGIVAVNRALTVRRLRESERAFRDLYENVNEGIFRSTLDGRMISANPYLVRLNGFESEAQMLREVNDIAGQWYVDPNRRAEINAILLEKGRATGVVSEVYRYRTRERIWIEENTRLVRDPKTGAPLYYDGTVREVTETVRRLELQRRYDKIAEAISGCLYQHRRRPNGKSSMPYASKGLTDLFGVHPDEVKEDASVLARLIHPDDMARIVASLDRSRETLTAWQCEYRVVLPGSPEKWIFAHAFPEREPDGSTLWHGFLTDVTERKHSEARIHSLAYFDALTGLPNRTQILDLLAQAQANSNRRRRWRALLFIDLDQFKLLNDTKGHLAGDRLLREVASRLRASTDRTSLVGRYGGDEFVVLIDTSARDRIEAEARVRVFASRVAKRLAAPYELDGSFFETTASIGVTLFAGNDQDADALLKQADLAMYEAKESGGGAIRFFEPEMQVAIEERLTLRRELREAIDNGELELRYQPQIDEEGRCVGAEALLRWRHPLRGEIKPLVFLGIAEPSGLGPMIDALVLRTACATLRAWQQHPATRGLNLSVNITAHQLSRPEFIATVADALKEAGADPSLLTLELTEHVMLDDVVEVGRAMTTLKGMGVKLALDDFGTGYSSLSHVRLLPLDLLKIDHSFVRDIEINPSDRAIVETILSFARSLNLSVVAEGVENERQLDLLLRLGCRVFQGFLFARPMTNEQFAAFAAADPATRRRAGSPSAA
ncbi:MAG TPA: EAL domain-containing protein [Bauldia sp.]|nr:EAL domain-containing protein [Bauldia sp.]